MILKPLSTTALLFVATSAFAADVVVHRDPGCGCCTKWAAIAQREIKRPVRMIDNPQRAAFAQKAGVPAALSSCHTAIIDGMAFEGHVPIADVKRALATRPKGVKGLAVAGMPIGSPGMEVPGVQAQRYSVIAFGPGGQKVFARD
ncbi:MAG: metal-binding protein [Alphaproteobacteria bacterium HGW-Alphaproteobacteria-16]|nr:MAG: metal-binding protein [Alphaproteobacteria bacterium HGW-Alphaproteobacteria-16]